MERLDHYTCRRLRPAILDLHESEVSHAHHRLFVRGASVVVPPIPDCLTIPMNGLVLIFSVSSILDVDIDGRRGTRVVVRRRRSGGLEQSLLLEGPADYFSVRAAGVPFTGPISEIRIKQGGRKSGRVARIGWWCQGADSTKNQIHRKPRCELPCLKRGRVAAD